MHATAHASGAALLGIAALWITSRAIAVAESPLEHLGGSLATVPRALAVVSVVAHDLSYGVRWLIFSTAMAIALVRGQIFAARRSVVHVGATASALVAAASASAVGAALAGPIAAAMIGGSVAAAIAFLLSRAATGADRAAAEGSMRTHQLDAYRGLLAQSLLDPDRERSKAGLSLARRRLGVSPRARPSVSEAAPRA